MGATIETPADLAGIGRADLAALLPYIPPEERAFVMDALASLTPEIVVETPELTLAEFVRAAWHVVEPGEAYLHNWHIDAIAELLTAITRGDVANAAINIPPRAMKSTLVSVMWPAWEWTLKPTLRYVTGSYDMGLATRDTGAMRTVVQSPWYQERWGHLVQLSADQNQKTRFRNTARGERIAVSVGSGGTGEGGHRVIVDDPLNAREAPSRVKRDEAIDWYRRTLSTRGNNPRAFAKIIVMQRLHERDLTGYVTDLMKEGGEHFEHLVLPMEWEPNRMVAVPEKPWTEDPRTEPGELLWPERFPDFFVANLKATLGPDAPGQLQQRPSPEGGGIYQMRWWAEGRNRYDVGDRQRVAGRWLLIDTAMKDKESNDFSACTLFELMADLRVRVRPLWSERLLFPALTRKIVETAEAWRGENLLMEVVIEDKQSGTSAIQTLQATAPGWLRRRIVAFQPVGDKPYRYRQSTAWCDLGCVLLPEEGDPRVPELVPLQYQLENVPAVEHDDYADTFAMGVIYLENYLAKGYQRRLRQQKLARVA